MRKRLLLCTAIVCMVMLAACGKEEISTDNSGNSSTSNIGSTSVEQQQQDVVKDTQPKTNAPVPGDPGDGLPYLYFEGYGTFLDSIAIEEDYEAIWTSSEWEPTLLKWVQLDVEGRQVYFYISNEGYVTADYIHFAEYIPEYGLGDIPRYLEFDGNPYFINNNVELDEIGKLESSNGANALIVNDGEKIITVNTYEDSIGVTANIDGVDYVGYIDFWYKGENGAYFLKDSNGNAYRYEIYTVYDLVNDATLNSHFMDVLNANYSELYESGVDYYEVEMVKSVTPIESVKLVKLVTNDGYNWFLKYHVDENWMDELSLEMLGEYSGDIYVDYVSVSIDDYSSGMQNGYITTIQLSTSDGSRVFEVEYSETTNNGIDVYNVVTDIHN